ncbi:MAG: hypothetical protein ACE5MK_13650 [Acidobacteriota bacterium]
MKNRLRLWKGHLVPNTQGPTLDKMVFLLEKLTGNIWMMEAQEQE